MLAEILILAATATGLAALVRAAPWPAAWAGRKPLACAACMSFHASAISLLYGCWSGAISWHGWRLAVLLLLAASGLSTWLLAQTGLFSAPLDFSTPEDSQSRGQKAA